jgi:hypothetical protein
MIFVLIDAAALLVGGSVAVLRARAQTRVEMAASMRLAEALVGDVAALAHQQLPAEQFLANLPVQLRSIRHVRVAVKNETGIPICPIPPTDTAARASAPRWFTELVAPPVEIQNVPVIINGSKVGEVEIGEPGDEIAEFCKTRPRWRARSPPSSGDGRIPLRLVRPRAGPSDRACRRPLRSEAAQLRYAHAQPQARNLLPSPIISTRCERHRNARAENLQLNQQLITAQDVCGGAGARIARWSGPVCSG